MKWYNFFSNFYDRSLDKIYGDSRFSLVKQLKLGDNPTVLDLGCGTGANFSYLKNHSPTCQIFGIDFSQGMLSKAQKRIDAHNYQGIHLLQVDVSHLSASLLRENSWPVEYDAIVCTLGLSVFPDWENVMAEIPSLLKLEGQCAVMDVFAKNETFHSRLVELIAGADLKRPIKSTIKNLFNEVSYEIMPVKESTVGGELFICIGQGRQTGFDA